MRILAVVPARSGSVGVPDKNIQEIGGKPLLGIAVEKLLSVSDIGKVIVSTDDQRYADIAREYGASIPFLRPVDLADSKTRLHYVLKHALEYYDEQGENFDAVLSLQATAPLLSQETVEKVIQKFISEDLHAIGTGSEVQKEHPYLSRVLQEDGTAIDFIDLPPGTPRYPRQKRPRLYFFNGCMFVRKRELLMNIDNDNNCLGEAPTLFPVNAEEAINIDEQLDLDFARYLYERKND